MSFLGIIFRLVAAGVFCVLILMLIGQRSKASALKDEVGSKNVELSVLSKKYEDLVQANEALEKRLAGGASGQQAAEVEEWANATKAQMQNYIDEVNRYTSGLIASAQAEADRIIASAGQNDRRVGGFNGEE